jgi:hypothetical protein
VAKFINHCGEPIEVQFTIYKQDCGRQLVQPNSEAYHPCDLPACGPTGPNVFDDCGGGTMLLHKDRQVLAAEYGRRDDGTGMQVLCKCSSSCDSLAGDKDEFELCANIGKGTIGAMTMEILFCTFTDVSLLGAWGAHALISSASLAVMRATGRIGAASRVAGRIRTTSRCMSAEGGRTFPDNNETETTSEGFC